MEIELPEVLTLQPLRVDGVHPDEAAASAQPEVSGGVLDNLVELGLHPVEQRGQPVPFGGRPQGRVGTEARQSACGDHP